MITWLSRFSLMRILMYLCHFFCVFRFGPLLRTQDAHSPFPPSLPPPPPSLPPSDHGNDLFKWGKKNPAQYSNCLPSYNEAEAYAKSIPLMGSKKMMEEGKEEGEKNKKKKKEDGKEQEGEGEVEGEEEEEEEEKEEEEDEDKCLSKEDKALLLSQIYANRAMAQLMLKYVYD